MQIMETERLAASTATHLCKAYYLFTLLKAFLGSYYVNSIFWQSRLRNYYQSIPVEGDYCFETVSNPRLYSFNRRFYSLTLAYLGLGLLVFLPDFALMKSNSLHSNFYSESELFLFKKHKQCVGNQVYFHTNFTVYYSFVYDTNYSLRQAINF